MPSYKNWKVVRKVSIGGRVSLTDEKIVGGSREHEAIEDFEKKMPLVQVDYEVTEATDEELGEYYES